MRWLPASLEQRAFAERVARGRRLARARRAAAPARAPLARARLRARGSACSTSPEPNAFALPGGQLLVTSALLAQAALRERARLRARRTSSGTSRDATRCARSAAACCVSLALAAIGGAEGASVAGSAAALGERTFSREQESAADRFALALVAAEYGHVAGATDFLRRLPDAAEAGAASRAASWLATHPRSADRVAELDALAQRTGLPEHEGDAHAVAAGPARDLASGSVSWSNWAGNVRVRAARCGSTPRARPRWSPRCATPSARASACASPAAATRSRRSSRPTACCSRSTASPASRATSPSSAASGCAPARSSRALGPALHALGLALENLGDVDVQALGGALATGTHGTGRTLPNLSARVSGPAPAARGRQPARAARGGRARAARRGARLARRARRGDGGAHRLRARLPPARARRAHADRRLPRGPRRAQRGEPSLRVLLVPGARPRRDQDDRADRRSPPEAVAGEKYERIGWSHEILPSVRELRFVEMEYALPARARPGLLPRRARAHAAAGTPSVAWPVEYRCVRADDAWLSTAHGRETVTLSLHQGAELPWQDFFADLEPLLRAHGGRPHWGKRHSLGGRRAGRALSALRRLPAAAGRARPEAGAS